MHIPREKYKLKPINSKKLNNLQIFLSQFPNPIRILMILIFFILNYIFFKGSKWFCFQLKYKTKKNTVTACGTTSKFKICKMYESSRWNCVAWTFAYKGVTRDTLIKIKIKNRKLEKKCKVVFSFNWSPPSNNFGKENSR